MIDAGTNIDNALARRVGQESLGKTVRPVWFLQPTPVQRQLWEGALSQNAVKPMVVDNIQKLSMLLGEVKGDKAPQGIVLEWNPFSTVLENQEFIQLLREFGQANSRITNPSDKMRLLIITSAPEKFGDKLPSSVQVINKVDLEQGKILFA